MPEGKIIKALSGFYYVKSDDEVYQCRGRGVFRKQKITPLVGDYVVFSSENPREGYILEIKERKNALIRPPIANVDQAFLIFSAKKPDFNPMLLDRFLVFMESYHINPVIVISKIDLLNEKEYDKIMKYVEDYEQIGYRVIKVSSVTGEGIDHIYPLLKDRISVFAGQSGVGKSSLLNTLCPDLDLETADISEHLGRGRHTTRHVELIEIAGGMVADTPGFSSLEFSTIEMDELSFCFPEMRSRLDRCRFRGCLHVKEPGCAVKEALDQGEIKEYRYQHYLIFMEEIRERKPRY